MRNEGRGERRKKGEIVYRVYTVEVPNLQLSLWALW